ncbi:MAG: hypothetical protein KC933_04205 [Myxococcales bacterium]|nr:hypothetical protein [Myxococcales bacterium]
MKASRGTDSVIEPSRDDFSRSSRRAASSGDSIWASVISSAISSWSR